MDTLNTEGITSLILYLALSLLLVFAVLLSGKYKNVFSHWKTALLLCVIYFLSMILGTGFTVYTILWAVGLFCQSIAGIAFTASLPDLQPFPIVHSVVSKSKPLRSCLIMIGISLVAAIAIMVTSGISMFIGQLLGEARETEDILSIVPENGYKLFFALLAGAGIMEGVTYRLVIQTFMLKVTKRMWPAILLSALVFAIYHFTPLNIMYKTYWQTPVTQLINVLLGGTIVGFLYAKRGFETSVLAHTLADWLPMMFLLFM